MEKDTLFLHRRNVVSDSNLQFMTYFRNLLGLIGLNASFTLLLFVVYIALIGWADTWVFSVADIHYPFNSFVSAKLIFNQHAHVLRYPFFPILAYVLITELFIQLLLLRLKKRFNKIAIVVLAPVFIAVICIPIWGFIWQSLDLLFGYVPSYYTLTYFLEDGIGAGIMSLPVVYGLWPISLAFLVITSAYIALRMDNAALMMSKSWEKTILITGFVLLFAALTPPLIYVLGNGLNILWDCNVSIYAGGLRDYNCSEWKANIVLDFVYGGKVFSLFSMIFSIPITLVFVAWLCLKMRK